MVAIYDDGARGRWSARVEWRAVPRHVFFLLVPMVFPLILVLDRRPKNAVQILFFLALTLVTAAIMLLAVLPWFRKSLREIRRYCEFLEDLGRAFSTS